MKIARLLLASVALSLFAQAALAGAPLKGVDVKLGKNPGGGCAARTTDAAGHANFGVQPTLPRGVVYTLVTVDRPAAGVGDTAHVSIRRRGRRRHRARTSQPAAPPRVRLQRR